MRKTDVDLERIRDFYVGKGIGSGRIGFGESPAILIVDVQNDFVDSSSPVGIGEPGKKVISSIRTLIEHARKVKIPVVYATSAFHKDISDAGLWTRKLEALKMTTILREGTRGTKVVDEIAPEQGDHVFVKHKSSAFFGTDLDVYLRARGIDTLIVGGIATSGCVRATVTDAFSHEYRVIIPKECVGDRSELPHMMNLFDMDMRFADVMPLETVISHIDGQGK